MARDMPLTRQALRTPRAAGVAGVIFSVLLAASLVLIRFSVAPTAHQSGIWMVDPLHRNALLVALNLVPFAGIAFLWFIGVVRDRMGQHEDRFFATVFLGSGILFVAMLFTMAAVAGGLAVILVHTPTLSLTSGLYVLGREIVYELMTIYAMRMAAVFMTVVATITLRTAILPRWLAYLGYALALVLLLSVGYLPWVELVFPLWVLLVSVHVLTADLPDRQRTLEGLSVGGTA
jgi:hypothetical protein